MIGSKDHVILVDEQDREVGHMEKLEAHQKGALHRAFSIFLYNDSGQMLLQKRAVEKYHSGALWSNTCCSHPVPGVHISKCLEEKLFQEMGIQASLQKAFDFKYKALLDNGLVEHEYDHVYVGIYNGFPNPNPEEVAAWRYADSEDLQKEIYDAPELFTPWFKLLLPRLAASDLQFR